MIPETEVVMLLNTNPMYRDLQSRITMLEQMKQIHDNASAGPRRRSPPRFTSDPGGLRFGEGTTRKLGSRVSRTWSATPSASGWSRRSAAWKASWRSPPRQLAAFEKEVEKKANEADNVGRGSVNIQMERAEVENIERILRGVAEEKERLRVELNAPDRVKVLGDPNAPAAVPENEARELSRYLFIVFGSVLAMLVPGVGIVVLDLRKERINSAERRVEAAEDPGDRGGAADPGDGHAAAGRYDAAEPDLENAIHGVGRRRSGPAAAKGRMRSDPRDPRSPAPWAAKARPPWPPNWP